MDTTKNNAAHCAFAVMLFDGFCASGGSVILPLLRDQYSLSYDVSGVLLALLSVGNLLAALLIGIVPRYWGVRRSAAVFTSGMLAGYGLMTVLHLPWLLFAGFFLIGMCKGSCMNFATTVIGAAGRDRTRSLNLQHALFALGSLLAPLVQYAGAAGVWWAPLAVLTASGAVVWSLFLIAGPSMADSTPKTEGKNDLSFLRERHFWYSVAFLFCQQCTEISVTGWVVTYFKDQGILSGAASGWTVTVVWGAMLVGRLFVAFVLPDDSKLRSLTGISVASGITYVLLMFAGGSTSALVCLFLFGLSMAGGFPTVVAQSSRQLNHAMMGVLLPLGGIGAIVMPYITGAVAQTAGIRAGMMCSLVSLAGMLIFSLLLKHTDH